MIIADQFKRALLTKNSIATKRIVDYIMNPIYNRNMEFVYNLAMEVANVSEEELNMLLFKACIFTSFPEKDSKPIKKDYWELTNKQKPVKPSDDPF